ncbi:sigma 54-interacting transcriptional regulator [Desulfobacter vibrioformis]|uniref:sigma 54-interacting transcriptional regulator n=1 Tax=Desulfobacter vibrioformis TaxID=34031 RepID=UPI00054D0662|nr:sigma 54-interacting transcriptional regulator [Desulfobacter vibrioformis]
MSINENDFFKQGTLHLFSSLDIETALQRFLAYLQTIMPADGILLGVYDPEINKARLHAVLFPEDMKKPSRTIDFPFQMWSFFKGKMQEAPGVRMVNDIDCEPPEVKAACSLIWSQDVSHIYMDLELENKRLGSFILFARDKRRYMDVHVRLVNLFHAPLISAISNVLKHQEIQLLQHMLKDDNEYLNRKMIEITGDTIIGADFGLSNVMRLIRQVAPMNSPVLLLGETGVGKEVMANAIHRGSRRKDCPLIKVNCGAIPEGLIDSELFGHEKGSFTGAISQKRGLFERAHTGTIFLDEVGELPLAAQVRLLRVLQEKEIERVGGTTPLSVDVRVISATHKNLEHMALIGGFRKDLWYRLNVFPIMIPPLRQRSEDIPALVTHLIDKKSKELKIRPSLKLSENYMRQLQQYAWPGNVRELENVLERVLITGNLHDVLPPLTMRKPAWDWKRDQDRVPADNVDDIEALDHWTRKYIQSILKKTEGRIEGKGGAADRLDLHPSTLRARMKKLNIAFGRVVKYS